MKSLLSSHFFWVLLAFIFSFDSFANENNNPYQTPGMTKEGSNHNTCAFAFLNSTLPNEETTQKVSVKIFQVDAQGFHYLLA